MYGDEQQRGGLLYTLVYGVVGALHPSAHPCCERLWRAMSGSVGVRCVGGSCSARRWPSGSAGQWSAGSVGRCSAG